MSAGVCASLLVALFALLAAAPSGAAELRALKTGLGDGVVTSSGTLACGTTCDETVGGTATVALTATPLGGSTFVGWDGACAGTLPNCTVTFSGGDLQVVARFDLSVPTLGNFTPAGIANFLTANPSVNTPARFVAALPAEYRQNWILMSRSESLQTGTARYPRILLPSNNGERVFTLGMTTDSSYPGAHPNAVEYMQWDPAQKNFRFHEIVLDTIPAMGTLGARSPGVAADDFKCTSCHSTGNILNNTSFPGTTGVTAGVVQPRNKPNWDTYDSWGGMMPFNRDRIYDGSVEEAAFRSLFNLWNWRASADNDAVRQVLEQLELQPSHSVPGRHSVMRNLPAYTDATHVLFGFDGLTPIGTTIEPVDYSFGGPAVASSNVDQGGRYVTMRTANPIPFVGTSNDTYMSPGTDEGRGVQLFDLVGGLDGTLNAQRVADELIDHRFATSNHAIDVRPLALAIADDCIQYDGTSAVVSTTGTPLSVATGFFDLRTGRTITSIILNTRARAESLPRRKADIQRLNLDRVNDPYLMSAGASNGLILEYGAGTAAGTSTTIQRLRQEVFQRPVDLGSGAVTVGGDYVDRELYTSNTEKMALFRYFLEPLGVPVDSWSMGVRGRSRTYTFADIFGSYENRLVGDLKADLTSRPAPALSNPNSCDSVVQALNAMYTTAQLPAANQVPTYTDIQRIFNRTCIECHNDLGYPPYFRYSGGLDLTEIENPTGTQTRFSRAHANASGAAASILNRITRTSEACPGGMMPCGGPALSKTDIETIRRWINGSTPSTVGDPHIRTVEGINYDFQAAGEFTLLRGENFELQARQVPVVTAGPLGPNAYTGLTSCVSVNSAMAVRFGAQRVTYQPSLSGQPDPSGLELRVDGVSIDPNTLPRTVGAVSLSTTGVQHQLKIQWAGGTEVVVTPRFWHHHQIWYMNLAVNKARAVRGMMGAIDPGEWLPALEDGSLLGPKPAPLQVRYDQLYDALGDSWRVTDDTTLFDYAPGTSTTTFTVAEWPLGESPEVCELPEPRPDGFETEAQEPIEFQVALELCNDLVGEAMRVHCVEDVAVTGEAELALAYFDTEQAMLNLPPTQPVLQAPADFSVEVESTVKLAWLASADEDGDVLTYRVCLWPADQVLAFDSCVMLGDTGQDGLLTWATADLEPDRAYLWKVIADDDVGASTESETWRFELAEKVFEPVEEMPE